MDRNTIALGIQHHYPDGFEGFDNSKSVPGNTYQEYLDALLDPSAALTEQQILDGAAAEEARFAANAAKAAVGPAFQEVFKELDPADKKKLYRGGLKAAIEAALRDGETETAKSLIEDAGTEDGISAATRTQMLALFP